MWGPSLLHPPLRLSPEWRAGRGSCGQYWGRGSGTGTGAGTRAWIKKGGREGENEHFLGTAATPPSRRVFKRKGSLSPTQARTLCDQPVLTLYLTSPYLTSPYLVLLYLTLTFFTSPKHTHILTWHSFDSRLSMTDISISIRCTYKPHTWWTYSQAPRRT